MPTLAVRDWLTLAESRAVVSAEPLTFRSSLGSMTTGTGPTWKFILGRSVSGTIPVGSRSRLAPASAVPTSDAVSVTVATAEADLTFSTPQLAENLTDGWTDSEPVTRALADVWQDRFSRNELGGPGLTVARWVRRGGRRAAWPGLRARLDGLPGIVAGHGGDVELPGCDRLQQRGRRGAYYQVPPVAGD